MIIAMALLLCAEIRVAAQTESFEKQAVALVRQMPASALDTELPKLPFSTWLTQQLGPQAGIVWQLTECGAPIRDSDQAEPDLRACTEVNASLPDGSKVIIAVMVGTFKKGIIGTPIFYYAVVERGEQLYQIGRLHEVPQSISKDKAPLAVRGSSKSRDHFIKLPAINLDQFDRQERTDQQYLFGTQLFSRANQPWLPLPRADLEENVVPPPTAPAFAKSGTKPGAKPGAKPGLPSIPSAETDSSPQRVSEGVIQGQTITRVKPIYPPAARMLNLNGMVMVEITISETGQVTAAHATSGHKALRSPAEDAAYKWVFRPTLLNGDPVKVQSILTFIFTPGGK
ncbi:MAG TPA: TonB family protein [Blastocatellia bacterium]|nr:TonB family protein [Blastocatellia bacterium]